jgi:glycosyltransferase involved in cell wall biosynthesis
VRILFTIGNAYFPQRAGGAQSSTLQLTEHLMSLGHEVAVMCRLEGGGWTEWSSRIKRRMSGARFSTDRHAGHVTYRAWDPTEVSEVVRQFRPDVAVVQNGKTLPIATSLNEHGVPVVLYFRNVEFDELEGSPNDLAKARFVANSHFTARKYRSEYRIEPTVIPPLVDEDKYKTQSSGRYVTFINPFPVKGLEIALQIARSCEDIPFLFQESWGLDAERRQHLDERLKALPNVTFQPRTADMKSVYGVTRILLAPSIWEEAWGRVATEAHYSAIPVIGSRQGGLPEAIGPGGVTLDHDAPISDWVDAVRLLWHDPDVYRRYADEALRFSQRSEMRPELQTQKLLEVLQAAIAEMA